MKNELSLFFRVIPWHMFLECLKLVKSKKVPRKDRVVFQQYSQLYADISTRKKIFHSYIWKS